MLADFVAEMTYPGTPISGTWKIYVDGSSNENGSIENSKGIVVEYSLKFKFKT